MLKVWEYIPHENTEDVVNVGNSLALSVGPCMLFWPLE